AESDIKPPEVPKVTPQSPVANPQQAATAQTPTATATTDVSGVEKSAIYRINADNTVDTLFSSKEENVYDILAGADGQFSFSTDLNGRLYGLTGDHKLTLTAQTNEAEAVRLMRWNGALLAATANMGRIYKLGATGAAGTYESPVYDAGGVAKWGRLRWQGQGATLQTRAGNSARPDDTWSDWSVPARDAAGTQITSPNARYLQFRAQFTAAGAAIDSVVAAYLPQNNPPLIRSITVLTQPVATPAQKTGSGSSSSGTAAFSVTVTDTGDAAPATSTGTATQTLSRAQGQQLLLSWQADDPDNDRLVYQVDFRGEGEREWKNLRRNLHENTLTLDGDVLADGRYHFRVRASDREANAEGTAKEAELISSPVLVDNTPPTIRVISSQRSGSGADVSFEAHDAASILRRVEWSMDAGPWTAVAPSDGVLDSETEQFRLHVSDVPAGEHLLVIRAVDSGGNTGLAKVILN
ncbi:MAG TPA: fibronectin type III domain-containing protein, partial [Bryobacteraceae bacterium]|nr:fibronectin type III domain-containing protein [Bryobacteraceae bacterium]